MSEDKQSYQFVGVAVDWIAVVMRKRVSALGCQMRGMTTSCLLAIDIDHALF